jgi:hypothetical protein
MSLTSLGHIEITSNNHGTARDVFAEAVTVFEEIGNDLYLPWCLEGLAAVHVELGDHATAAQLDGARDAVQARTGMSLPPFHPSRHTKTLEAVRATLEHDQFEAKRNSGTTGPPTATIAAALAAPAGAKNEHTLPTR